MASQIFDRLISHSRFVPVMLNMQQSVLPLPAAAQKLSLRSPIASILPLVECNPVPQVHFFIIRCTSAFARHGPEQRISP